MWQLLAKPLLGVVADGVKGFVATKKMKGELKLTEIKACSVVITIPSKNGNSSTRTIFLDGYEQFVSGSHIQ